MPDSDEYIDPVVDLSGFLADHQSEMWKILHAERKRYLEYLESGGTDEEIKSLLEFSLSRLKSMFVVDNNRHQNKGLASEGDVVVDISKDIAAAEAAIQEAEAVLQKAEAALRKELPKSDVD